MTYLGLLFIVLFIISLFKPYKYIVGLLLVSCIFQASSVIDINGRGVQPYLVGAIFLIVRTFLRINGAIYSILKNRFTLLVLFFMIYSIFVSILMPFVFRGLVVFDKSLDESVMNGGIKLQFGFSNITQIGYVIINGLTLCCLWINRFRISYRDIVIYFHISILLFLVIGFWEFTSKYTGLNNFPSSFFYTNYEMGGEAYLASTEGILRMNATMTEASFCGAMLAASFWGVMMNYIYKNNIQNLILIILIAIALVLNISGTGLITFFFGGLFFLWFVKAKVKFIFHLCGIFVLLFGIVYFSGYWSDIISLISNKQESQSGIVRTLATINSWNLFCDSYGLGVGLGSNRGGNLPIDLLASLGLVGTCLFYIIFIKLFFCYRKRKESMFVSVYLLTLMVAQCIAIPDISFCSMWFGLYIAASLGTKDVHQN